jgi:hypothetical protein
MAQQAYSESIDRRGFLGATGALLVSAATSGGRRVLSAERAEPPRVAAIITEYRSLSHADVILGRMLNGYILSTTETYVARTKVVSMYVAQFPAGDLSRGMASQYGVPIKPTIAEALTLGTGQLAVDGVLIIGEHGDYPENKKGQKMYPRRRFFEETVKTFCATGSSAPVFNDKHLGFAWDDAKWMYDQSRRMKFPLIAGSSVPTAWRKPDVELPLGVELESALAVGYSGIEIYGFHTLELLQCMVERRRGGESGVRAVTCLEGADVWKAASGGKWSRGLLDAAADCLPDHSAEPPERVCKNPVAFLIENTDGFRSVALLLDGFTAQFGFACQVKGNEVPVATNVWMQEPGYGHFSYLVHNIESMYLTGKEPYPPERTLLTTGILDAVMTSRFEGHRRVETPWLSKIAYQATGITSRRAKF